MVETHEMELKRLEGVPVFRQRGFSCPPFSPLSKAPSSPKNLKHLKHLKHQLDALLPIFSILAAHE